MKYYPDIVGLFHIFHITIHKDPYETSRIQWKVLERVAWVGSRVLSFYVVAKVDLMRREVDTLGMSSVLGRCFTTFMRNIHGR